MQSYRAQPGIPAVPRRSRLTQNSAVRPGEGRGAARTAPRETVSPRLSCACCGACESVSSLCHARTVPKDGGLQTLVSWPYPVLPISFIYVSVSCNTCAPPGPGSVLFILLSLMPNGL